VLRLLFVCIGLVSSLLVSAERDCDMKIETIKHEEGKSSLLLTYDKLCEVLVDHEGRKVVLTVKPHTLADMNGTGFKQKISAGKVEKLLSLAKSKLGDSYQPAQAGPDHFDCSGFVYYVYKENGIAIPRTSRTQSESGEKIDRGSLKPGDILFFDTHEHGHVNHSGIYLGEGKFIHPSSGKAYGVTISNLDTGFYKDKFRWGVRKIDP